MNHSSRPVIVPGQKNPRLISKRGTPTLHQPYTVPNKTIGALKRDPGMFPRGPRRRLHKSPAQWPWRPYPPSIKIKFLDNISSDNVRLGSGTDISRSGFYVRFAPNNGRKQRKSRHRWFNVRFTPESGRFFYARQCPLIANSGHLDHSQWAASNSIRSRARGRAYCLGNVCWPVNSGLPGPVADTMDDRSTARLERRTGRAASAAPR